MPYEIDFLESYDRDSIAAELRRIADQLCKKTVTIEDIDQYGRVGAKTVINRFGSMRAALIGAGLVPTRGRQWTNTELIRILTGVWDKTQRDFGRSPRQTDFKRYKTPVCAYTVGHRFGTWRKALIAASQVSATGVIPEIQTAEPRRLTLSVRTRFNVFKRDSYTCCICKRAGVPIEVDHIVPLRLGGASRLDNLQTLCTTCNRGKRDSLQ